jgi:hypothetical protein
LGRRRGAGDEGATARGRLDGGGTRGDGSSGPGGGDSAERRCAAGDDGREGVTVWLKADGREGVTVWLKDNGRRERTAAAGSRERV